MINFHIISYFYKVKKSLIKEIRYQKDLNDNRPYTNQQKIMYYLQQKTNKKYVF